MGISLKATVVIIAFPFSDLSAVKRRPDLVVADWGGDDVILAQITSVANKDQFAIALHDNNFAYGNLKNTISFIRPNKLFTADKKTLLQTIGKVNDGKMQEVIFTITGLMHGA